MEEQITKFHKAIKWIAIFIFVVWLASFFISCGSRKVEANKQETEVKTESKEVVKSDVKTDSKIKEETKIIVTDSTKEEIEETIIETPTLKTTKRKIKRSVAIKKENNTNITIDKNIVDNTQKTSVKEVKIKTNNQTKKVDRKQFDIIGLILSYWWLWILILIALWAYRKYKNTFMI